LAFPKSGWAVDPQFGKDHAALFETAEELGAEGGVTLTFTLEFNGNKITIKYSGTLSGDTIKIVFKNNATHAYSMHPHGVLYEKDSEGADYNDGTSGTDKEDGGVPPGATHTYLWRIPERSGPGRNDPSSVFWLYHSHTDELRDVASGHTVGVAYA
jgi:hypothetical protein